MSLLDIETIIIAIMENRSFDHMLGYLSLDASLPVDGLHPDQAWQDSYINDYAGKPYKLHRIDPVSAPCSDPQHDRQSIAIQINTPPEGPGPQEMGGFVQSYVRFSDPTPTDPSAVMGYFDAAALPTFDFFARNYCVCDHWFSSLPLGTQANRLMAMAGESTLLDNSGALLPDQQLVYDWLTQHQISWCAYQSGDFLPFFTLMARLVPEIATSLTLSQIGGKGRFRRYSQLKSEWNSSDTMPNVVFIEPEYTDGPHDTPNDDHAPTGVQPGQAFLADLYATLISNPARWAKTMLVVTYDEHGGFFDHVPPFEIPITINGVTLPTTGVRVPAFVVSPYVSAGYVFQGNLDHTSLLQLLDDRFVTGEGYSVAVNNRQTHFNRLLNALTKAPRIDVPRMEAAVEPPKQIAVSTELPTAPHTPNAQALHVAAQKIADEHPELLAQPGWEKLNAYLNRPQS